MAPTEEVLEHVTATLNRGPYLLGEQFTSADVLFGSSFALFLGSPLLPKTDVLSAYVERLLSRPAFLRAAAKDDG